MAKKQQNAIDAMQEIIKGTDFNLSKKRDPTDPIAELDKGNIKPTGVGLRVGEIEALDKIGAALGQELKADPVARNTLIRIAVRSLLLAFYTGKMSIDDLLPFFTVPEKPKPKIKF